MNAKQIAMLALPLCKNMAINSYSMEMPKRLHRAFYEYLTAKNYVVRSMKQHGEEEENTGEVEETTQYLPSVQFQKFLEACNFEEIIMPIPKNPDKQGAEEACRNWVISTSPISIPSFARMFRHWIQTDFSTTIQKTQKGETDVLESLMHRLEEKKELLIRSASEDLLNATIRQERRILIEDGKIRKETYKLLPFLVQSILLEKKRIEMKEGTNFSLFRKKRGVLMTEPFVVEGSSSLKSINCTLSIKTLPPDDSPFLQIDVSSTRWVSKPSKKGAFSRNEHAAFVRTENQNLIELKMERKKLSDQEEEENSNNWVWCWTEDSKNLYDAFLTKQLQVSISDVLAEPTAYLKNRENDIYIPVSAEWSSWATEVETGLTASDLETMSTFVRETLKEQVPHWFENNGEFPILTPICESGAKGAINLYKTMFDKQGLHDAKEVEQALKELYPEGVGVELWYGSNAVDRIDRLRDCLSKLFPKSIRINEVFVSPFAGMESKEKEKSIASVRKKYEEWFQSHPLPARTTIALCVIHDEMTYRSGRSYDPKLPIRIEAALSGRLTQFLTINGIMPSEKKQSKKTSKKEQTAEENKQSMEELPQAVMGAVKDVFRALGVLPNEVLDVRKKEPFLSDKKSLRIGAVYGMNKNVKKRTYGLAAVGSAPIYLLKRQDLASIQVFYPYKVVQYHNRERVVVESGCITCTYSEFPIQFLALRKKYADMVIYGNPEYSKKFFLTVNRDAKENEEHALILVDATTLRNSEKWTTNKALALSAEGNYVEGRPPLEKLNASTIVRVHSGSDVPDYYPAVRTENTARQPKDPTKPQRTNLGDYHAKYGIYQSPMIDAHLFYTRHSRSSDSSMQDALRSHYSAVTSKKRFAHKLLREMYVIHINEGEDAWKAVQYVHNMCSGGVPTVSDAKPTIRPWPLHLAMKLVEDYVF